jgi:hypothetical protein
MEGGIAHFPGLSRPSVIDSDELPEEEAGELERRVEAARFFDLATTVGTPPRGAADYRQYTVTVEAGGQQHTVRLADPVGDPNLQALLDYLKKRARALRTGVPGRPSDKPG